jgi:HSP20 family molecular chaperone IbpA
MFVEVTTGKEKVVKVFKSNEIQNYTSSVDLMFEDTRQARNFIGAMKYLASNVKQSEKSFSDSQSAFKYISSNLPAVSTGTYKYDQTIEMIDNDPCKIKFSVTQLDSKDVSTGYVYEFAMADINPDAVKLEISGKEMTVKLETRGKQKLIKPYKNGEPQNFDYDFELFSDDVIVARNIVSAIKTMAGKCGK